MEVCKLCGREFKNKAGLSGHLRMVHGIHSPNEIEYHFEENNEDVDFRESTPEIESINWDLDRYFVDQYSTSTCKCNGAGCCKSKFVELGVDETSDELSKKSKPYGYVLLGILAVMIIYNVIQIFLMLRKQRRLKEEDEYPVSLHPRIAGKLAGY